ncbi:alpha-L-rhamnosidase-related protein [Saccharicrinis sp. GN24d3]|uniref:alpha-L-rhamnosidase-related protein n=1 Tax=Saccharicrinis sp. GN24d3 TaxID=3458416 RepID=UPI0040360A0C
MRNKFKKNSIVVLIIFMLLPFAKLSGAASTKDWGKAQWIWQEEAGPANTWVAFRKTISLDEVPSEAITHISVDTKYWLWINGEMVLFEGGLCRGAGHNTIYCDPVDFGPYLKEGENTVAILVWYWGRTRKPHDDSGQGGLYIEADWTSDLNSNASWKMKVHSAYDPKGGGGGNSANRVNAYNVKYDARKAMGDWTENAWYTSEFDDNNWDVPTEKGTANSLPWGAMVERCIPQWNDRGLVDYQALSIQSGEEKIAIKLPFKNNTDTSVVISAKLPFNQQITPYLKVRSSGGKTIVMDTDNGFNLLKSIYTTKGGVQAFEGYTWFNGHYVEYAIPSGVEVQELKYRWTGVGDMPGTFVCSDDFYTRLWWMARNTLYVCARDNYMDCPDRERGLWIGDVADQTGAVFYTLDEPGRLLLKKGIDNTIAYRNGDTIQGLAPGFGAYRGKSSELTGQSLQYIDQGIWQYYYNSGDTATLENAYPAVLNYLKLWEMKTDGLPRHRKGYANWVDWGVDPDPTPTNVVLYYMALKAAQKMAAALNKNKDMAWYDSRINSIKKNFEKVYWQGKRYGSKNNQVEERVSSLAIISGLADKRHYDLLVDSVLLPIQKASPHMEWLAEEAIMLTGQYDKGLLRMKQRYASQANQEDLSTLYEKYYPKLRGTYNHAWNAPNYVLSRYIAGIKATDVAWSEFEVKPNMAHLSHIKQIVPCVKGDILLEVNKTKSTYTLELTSPEHTTATVFIPKNGKEISEVVLNDQIIWKKGKLKNNVSDLKFDQSDEDYVSFKVAGGHWNFRALNK